MAGADWNRGTLSIDGSFEQLPGRFRGTASSPPLQMASVSLVSASLGVLARNPRAAAGPYFRAALGLAGVSRSDATSRSSAPLGTVGLGYAMRARNLRVGIGVYERMIFSSYASGSTGQVANIIHVRVSVGPDFR